MNRKQLLLKLLLCQNGVKRAEYLKKNKVFYTIGVHC